MNFVRGADPKQALGIGLGPKIKNWMSHSRDFSYDDIFEVWTWALRRKKDIVFPYLVGLNGKKWVNGEKIDFSDPDFLWDSVSEGNVAAVKALLTIPNLFPEEVFILDQGASELKGQYVERGDEKRPMRATNFGAYVNLASRYMHENRPNPEVKQLLMDYYNKYHGL